tara:strand:+ start:161520 stop:161837 length:318 start_codon:yes stop_codon:yes gene_type:complete
MEKLKQRWGLESNFAVFIILIVFALTGSSSLKIARPVLDYIGFTREIFSDDWHYSILYWTLRILIIFPIYQILLLAFGWLFGQFNFFWNIEKKMLKRLGFGFLLK